jgi:UDP-3-O-[3-hydroxymyristoyl] N-acetylglucosamine deacetylase
MRRPASASQTTLGGRIVLSGVGVHGGRPVSMALNPADSGTGVVFVRMGDPGGHDVEIPALSSHLGATELCTVLGDPRGRSVATVEHLLAALSALGVDNATVEIDGPEVPVMDGSAEAFVDAIDRVGLARQSAPRRFIRVLRPVRVDFGQAFAEFRPCAGRRFEVGIDFDCAVIGRQTARIDLTPASFRRDVARARTFGHMRDVERLWAAGFALGSSLENTVVIGDNGIVNPEGLRYRDEFARHKLLDAIGDLALAGAPILGLYRSHRSGHRINAAALAALMARRDAWEFVTGAERAVERAEAFADFLPGLPAPAFAPERS